MDFESLHAYCLSLPGATEKIQWENDLLFQVGGKTFVFAGLSAPWSLSIKCSEEEFAELIERDGIIPAPYLAQHKWVQLKSLTSLPERELKERIHKSYHAVAAKLSKTVQRSLHLI
ncbi:MAG TPA: MmcQ/YjbR family DNA-binding protein [Candidatus Kapabacteria bacterium]|nr:MmcQ/YjbR family DNA-binding protein [Candidatus Kapabacteria bacterium]